MPEVTLDLNYDSVDSIPEAYRGLYDEGSDGRFVFAGVSGMKTQKDINNVQEALRKEREDHKKVKETLSSYSSLGDLSDIQSRLDRITELEAAAGGNLDEDKLNQMVEGRITQRTAPLERQIESITNERDTLTAENQELKTQIETRDRNEVIRNIAVEMGVVSTAIPDVELIAGMYFERNEMGEWVTKADCRDVTPGIDPKQFFKEMQKIRRHWFPEPEGGGAGGGGNLNGGEANPWKADTWNVTQQGQLINKDRELATRLAKAAGTVIGGPRPAAK